MKSYVFFHKGQIFCDHLSVSDPYIPTIASEDLTQYLLSGPKTTELQEKKYSTY